MCERCHVHIIWNTGISGHNGCCTAGFVRIRIVNDCGEHVGLCRRKPPIIVSEIHMDALICIRTHRRVLATILGPSDRLCKYNALCSKTLANYSKQYWMDRHHVEYGATRKLCDSSVPEIVDYVRLGRR